MANIPQLGAPGCDDDSQEMPTCKDCGAGLFFEHYAGCPVLSRQPPMCGEDHIVGDLPRDCFACLDHHFETLEARLTAAEEALRQVVKLTWHSGPGEHCTCGQREREEVVANYFEAALAAVSPPKDQA